MWIDCCGEFDGRDRYAADGAQRAPTPAVVQALRLLHGLLVIGGCWLSAAFLVSRSSAALRWQQARSCARALLRSLAVRVEVRGWKPDSGRECLIVGNHVSWLDTYVIHSVRPHARFVAKAEVRRWPLVGTMAEAFQTFFIRRGSCRDAARVKDALAAALGNGETVAVFPEGTTSDGSMLGRFYPALFQAAVDARADVQPVVIRYLDAGGRASNATAFIGDMTLLESLGRILREPWIEAEIVFCTPIPSVGRTRRELAALAHASIARALGFDCPALDDWLGPQDEKRAA
jgi:1-acyl-sn-glycerol-3-phosphate acyltransferase